MDQHFTLSRKVLERSCLHYNSNWRDIFQTTETHSKYEGTRGQTTRGDTVHSRRAGTKKTRWRLWNTRQNISFKFLCKPHLSFKCIFLLVCSNFIFRTVGATVFKRGDLSRRGIHVFSDMSQRVPINTSRLSNVELWLKSIQARPTGSTKAKAGRPEFTLLSVGKTTHCIDLVSRFPSIQVPFKRRPATLSNSLFTVTFCQVHKCCSLSQLLQVTNTISVPHN